MEDTSEDSPVTGAILGEIALFAHKFVPKGWAACNGQKLSIQSHEALFRVIGTHFGGDGRSNFALPDLRGTMIVHSGESKIGETGGEEQHVLAPDEMPGHSHALQANGDDESTEKSPNGNLLAISKINLYGKGAPVFGFNVNASGQSGENQGHDNMQPSLALNYCIAIAGYA